MKELLEGRRIGFALRPAFGNVAVGLGAAVAVLDLMAWGGWGARDTNGFVVGAYWLVIATAIVALLAAITSVAEMADAPDEEAALARLDLGGMGVATLIYAASAVLRSGELGAAGASPAPFLLGFAGLVLLVVVSWMGSLLYAGREWEVIEDIAHERQRRRHAASR